MSEEHHDETEPSEAELIKAAFQEFVYCVSHDLQGPLRAVIGFSKVLAKTLGDDLDPKQAHYLETVVDSAHRTQAMIEGLVEYSRVETRGGSVETTSPSKILDQVIVILSETIRESAAKITYDELPDVKADARQIKTIFHNLIENAVKFQREDGPEIHISARDHSGGRIPDQSNSDERDGEPVPSMWQFSVSDNGIGIEPKQTERIFKVFQRLHTKEEISGIGMGLPVCKRIIQRHGGTIWVESVPGSGSTFHFSLPKAEADE